MNSNMIGDYVTLQYIVYIVLGYISGSVLYAIVWGFVFAGKDIRLEAADKNPGTYNAFACGGMACGILTLVCDLLKGFLPVFLCLNLVDYKSGNEYLMALVVLAPIIGHILPLWHKFRGGKGIAVSFGCLLGFAPDLRPALLLAIVFIFFSLVLVISPDYYKTMATYILSAIISPFVGYRLCLVVTYIAAAILITLRLILGEEDKDKLSLSLLGGRVKIFPL